MRRRLQHPLVDDVDDRARRPRTLPGEILRQKKWRAQIGFHMLVPARRGWRLPIVILEQRGGIDQGGERPHLTGRATDQLRGFVLARQIGLEGRGLYAKGARVGGGVFGLRGGAVIMDRDVPARRRQIQGDGASQPFGGAGDQNGSGFRQ